MFARATNMCLAQMRTGHPTASALQRTLSAASHTSATETQCHHHHHQYTMRRYTTQRLQHEVMVMVKREENHEHKESTTRSLVTLKGGPSRTINVQKDLYPRPSTLEMSTVDGATDVDLANDLESAAEYVKLLTVPYVPECEGRIVKYFHEISHEEQGILPPTTFVGMSLFAPLMAIFRPVGQWFGFTKESTPSRRGVLPIGAADANAHLQNPVRDMLRKRMKIEAARIGANCIINARWQEVTVPLRMSVGIRTTLVGDAVLIEKRSDIEKRNKAEKSELQAEKDVVNVERGFETAPARREGLGVYSDQ